MCVCDMVVLTFLTATASGSSTQVSVRLFSDAYVWEALGVSWSPGGCGPEGLSFQQKWNSTPCGMWVRFAALVRLPHRAINMVRLPHRAINWGCR